MVEYWYGYMFICYIVKCYKYIEIDVVEKKINFDENRY